MNLLQYVSRLTLMLTQQTKTMMALIYLFIFLFLIRNTNMETKIIILFKRLHSVIFTAV